MHENVVGVEGAQFHRFGALREGVEELADDFDAAFERLGAGRAAHAGGDRRALGADERIVEGHELAGVLGERLALDEIGGKQHAQRVRPALDRVRHLEYDLLAVRARDHGQLGDVVRLHREAHAGAAEQQPERLLEEARAVAVRRRAIVHARVLLQDRIAAELHGALAPEHQPLEHALANLGEQVLDVQTLLLEVAAVHVDDAIHRLFVGFAAVLFGNIAAVFGREDIILKRFNAHGSPIGFLMANCVLMNGSFAFELQSHRFWDAGALPNLVRAPGPGKRVSNEQALYIAYSSGQVHHKYVFQGRFRLTPDGATIWITPRFDRPPAPAVQAPRRGLFWGESARIACGDTLESRASLPSHPPRIAKTAPPRIIILTSRARLRRSAGPMFVLTLSKV